MPIGVVVYAFTSLGYLVDLYNGEADLVGVVDLEDDADDEHPHRQHRFVQVGDVPKLWGTWWTFTTGKPTW